MQSSLSTLIHKWIPTNSFLHKQGGTTSSICPRCKTSEDDADHILHYDHQTACSSRTNHTYIALSEVNKMTSCPAFLHTLEDLLMTQLHIPFNKMTSCPAFLHTLEHLLMTQLHIPPKQYEPNTMVTIDNSIRLTIHQQKVLR